MEFSLECIPNSGSTTAIYMDISVQDQLVGRISIKLYRDVFPAAVENFIAIAKGNTYKTCKSTDPRYRIVKKIRRSFDNTKFFKTAYNNYVVGGDIYNNNGTGLSTIYNDVPIPESLGDFFFPHESKGLISLIPFKDENGEKFYDSTFMITLDNHKNTRCDLDENQIVIGKIYSGIEVIDKINKLIVPFAGKKYPRITISKAGIINNQKIKRKSLLKNL